MKKKPKTYDTHAKEADPDALLEDLSRPDVGGETLDGGAGARAGERAPPGPGGAGEEARRETGVSGVPLEIPEEAVRRLEEELAELKDRHARLAAEFDNYRKRINRERLELGNRAQGAFAIRLLEVLDDLDRILAGVEQTTPSPSLLEALVLVDRKLRKELEGAGLERIDPVGERFDPSRHEAVSAAAPPTPKQDQQVSATFQAGYLFKGSLIRPARVQVYSDPDQG